MGKILDRYFRKRNMNAKSVPEEMLKIISHQRNVLQYHYIPTRRARIKRN